MSSVNNETKLVKAIKRIYVYVLTSCALPMFAFARIRDHKLYTNVEHVRGAFHG